MNSPRSRRLRSIYRGGEQEQKVRDWCADRLDRWTLLHRRDVVQSCVGLTHLVSVGSGSPTVVVVPGTNVSAALLEEFAAALAPTSSVLLLDIPGQPGLSVGHRPSRGDAFFPPQRLRGPAGRRLETGLTVVPDAGHLVTDEQPQALASLVTAVRFTAAG